MFLFLVHHADAVGPKVDPQRPLSILGRTQAERAAEAAASRGARPAVIWHSGKLRARQTGEAFWNICNPSAEFCASRDLQPGDPPSAIANRLLGEVRDLMIVGHYPHLPALLTLLVHHGSAATFPLHGVVALEREDEGETWREAWRITNG
jgi:phosphohistidine phosphatase